MLLFVVFVACVTLHHCDAQSCRDRREWPFSPQSIWNMPIGSKAEWIDADVFANTQKHPLPSNFFGDEDYFYSVYADSSCPETKWYEQGDWNGPNGHCNISGKLLGDIRFPDNVFVTEYGNNAAAILQTDNVTLLQMQPLYRCSYNNAPGPVLAQKWGLQQNVSILGDGIFGAHGGSHLSSIGGTIRKGELISTEPNNIKHALKLEFLANEYYYGGYNAYPCYRWPADACDGYWHDNSSRLVYNGSNQWFTPGALLAVPDDVKVSVSTEPGKKILFALQNYGGYLCDDTAANRGTMCVEYGVKQEFESYYNMSFDAKKGDVFYNDLLAIFEKLKIVKNNNQSSVGGGGTPIQPLAPPICNT